MNKRPLAVLIFGTLLIAAGAMGLVYHASELREGGAFHYDALGVSLVRMTAIVAGVFILRQQNWARWLGLIWIALHVLLSFYHSLGEVVFHALLLAVFAYFLFRPNVSAYFKK